MIKITFPDGNVKEFAKGTTAYQVAESISPRLAADCLAASVNGATVDMTRAIDEDATIKFYKWEDAEGKHAFWHTSSHLLAEALQSLYPGIKFGIGPAIENGFYYDVDSPTPITEVISRPSRRRCRSWRAGRRSSAAQRFQKRRL